jgi:hypothetical protein
MDPSQLPNFSDQCVFVSQYYVFALHARRGWERERVGLPGSLSDLPVTGDLRLRGDHDAAPSWIQGLHPFFQYCDRSRQLLGNQGLLQRWVCSYRREEADSSRANAWAELGGCLAN